MQNRNTQSILIILLASVLLLGAVGAFWYVLVHVESQLHAVRAATADSSAQQYDKLQALRKESRATEDARHELQALALSEEAVPDFLALLEGYGSESAAVFVRSVEVLEDGAMLAVSLESSADIDTVHALARRLSTIPYAVLVDFLEMRTGRDDLWDVRIRLQVPLLET